MKKLYVYISIGIVLAGSILATTCFGIRQKEKHSQWNEQYDVGMQFLLDGEYEEAIIAFSTAIDIEPKNDEAYIGLIKAYIATNDYDTAEKVFASLRKNDSNSNSLSELYLEIQTKKEEYVKTLGREQDISIYRNFLSNVIIPQQGLADVETINATDPFETPFDELDDCGGLLSAYIIDMDADGTNELLVLGMVPPYFEVYLRIYTIRNSTVVPVCDEILVAQIGRSHELDERVFILNDGKNARVLVYNELISAGHDYYFRIIGNDDEGITTILDMSYIDNTGNGYTAYVSCDIALEEIMEKQFDAQEHFSNKLLYGLVFNSDYSDYEAVYDNVYADAFSAVRDVFTYYNMLVSWEDERFWSIIFDSNQYQIEEIYRSGGNIKKNVFSEEFQDLVEAETVQNELVEQTVADEKSPIEFIGKTLGDLFAYYGTNYEIDALNGSTYFKYPNSPYFFIGKFIMPDSVKDSYQIRSIYAYENYDFIEGLTTNMTFSEVKECVGEKVSLDDPIAYMNYLDYQHGKLEYALDFTLDGYIFSYIWEDDPEKTDSYFVWIKRVDVAPTAD